LRSVCAIAFPANRNTIVEIKAIVNCFQFMVKTPNFLLQSRQIDEAILEELPF